MRNLLLPISTALKVVKNADRIPHLEHIKLHLFRHPKIPPPSNLDELAGKSS
jgi:hypothetical protein